MAANNSSDSRQPLTIEEVATSNANTSAGVNFQPAGVSFRARCSHTIDGNIVSKPPSQSTTPAATSASAGRNVQSVIGIPLPPTERTNSAAANGSAESQLIPALLNFLNEQSRPVARASQAPYNTNYIAAVPSVQSAQSTTTPAAPMATQGGATQANSVVSVAGQRRGRNYNRNRRRNNRYRRRNRNNYYYNDYNDDDEDYDEDYDEGYDEDYDNSSSTYTFNFFHNSGWRSWHNNRRRPNLQPDFSMVIKRSAGSRSIHYYFN